MREVVLRLTPLEAAGLYALADEGASGLFTDEQAARGYIGDARAVKAAERALYKLRDASREAQEAKAAKTA